MKTTVFSILSLFLVIILTCNSCKQNTSPVASISGDSKSFVGDNLLLDGSGSSDADNDSLIYNWFVISGPGDEGEVLQINEPASCLFVPDVGGSYTVELIVNDGTIDSEPVTMNIDVLDFHGRWVMLSRTPAIPNVPETMDTIVFNEDGTYESHSYYKYQGKVGLTFIGKGLLDSPVGMVEYTEITMPMPPSMDLQTFTKENDPNGILKNMNTQTGEGKSIYMLSDEGNTLTTKYDGNNDGDFDDIGAYSLTSDWITVWTRIE